MKQFFRVALAWLALAGAAHAQQQVGAGQVLGNSGASRAPAQAASVTAILDRALGSTRGAIIQRGASGWVLFGPGATARVPYLSGGTGADPILGAFTLPSSVTSGGVACYTSTTAQGSSALLVANGVLVGGGAGACPSTVTALVGRSSTVLNIDQMTTNGDSNLSISATTRTVVTTTALTAARTWTLPAANALNAGQSLLIMDQAGAINGANTISVVRSGSDTLNGGTSISILSQYAGALLVSDGVSKWTSFSASVSGGVTSVTPGAGLVSSAASACSQSAITSTGTLSAAECTNAQTGTSYAIVDGDRGKLVTASNAAAQAYTIAQAGAASAFQNGWFVDVRNISTNAAGIVTITPTTSTIGGGSTYVLGPGRSARIVSDGTNYLIASTGGVPTLPTVQTFLSGSGTWTSPSANVRWIRVRLIGGGGGGAGSGTGSPGTGGTGGDSTFNTTSCVGGGGTGGNPTTDNAGVGGSSSGGSILNITGGYGGGASAVAQSGGIGGSGYYGGAGAGGRPGAADPGLAGRTNTGGGGGGASTGTNVEAGGGAGGYCETIITSPAASYAYAVGAAGAAGTAGTAGAAGGAGGSGQVVVEEHYN